MKKIIKRSDGGLSIFRTSIRVRSSNVHSNQDLSSSTMDVFVYGVSTQTIRSEQHGLREFLFDCQMIGIDIPEHFDSITMETTCGCDAHYVELEWTIEPDSQTWKTLSEMGFRLTSR